MTQANEAGRRVGYTIFPIPPPFLEKYLLFLKQVRHHVCSIVCNEGWVSFCPYLPTWTRVHPHYCYFCPSRKAGFGVNNLRLLEGESPSYLHCFSIFPPPLVPRLFLSRSALAKTRKWERGKVKMEPQTGRAVRRRNKKKATGLTIPGNYGPIARPAPSPVCASSTITM